MKNDVEPDFAVLNAEIGERARRIRKARGMSQVEAADLTEAAGFKMSAVNLLNLEKGRVRWNVQHFVVMGRVYRVDPVAFLVDIEEQGLLKTWRQGGAPELVAQLLSPVEAAILQAWRDGGAAGVMALLAQLLSQRE